MKRAVLALGISLLILVLILPGCSATKVSTKTEFETVTPPVSIQTISVAGPASTSTQTITATVTQTINSTITAITTAIVTGPTTTLTATKTSLVTQGFTYVSAIAPASPATLHLNDWVTVTLDYVITDPGGAKMFALPMTNGVQTPNCSTGSQGPVATGKGTTTGLGFSVASGSGKITEIRLLMRNPSQTITFFDVSIPVDFTYGP